MKKIEAGLATLKKKSPLASKKSYDTSKATLDIDDNASDVTDGVSEYLEDVIDGRGAIADPTRTKAAIDHLKQKVDKTKLNIKMEQGNKEENVNEYLRLSNDLSDKSSLQKHKSAFEKNNQKAAAAIAQLQKKLEIYNRRLREVEQHGLSAHRPAKELLKDVSQGLRDFGGNLKDGVLGLSGSLVTKPKELLASRGKFGSADNINDLSKVEPLALLPGIIAGSKEDSPSPTNSSTLPSNLKMPFHDETVAKQDKVSTVSDGSSPHDSPHVNGHVNLFTSPQPLQPLLSEMAADTVAEQRNFVLEGLERIANEMELLKVQYCELQEEVVSVKQMFEEERYRYEHLEEHLNDMAELYHNELTNLKQEVANMEEKLEYQLEERARDMHEAMESCNTKISKMELQNQQQQLVSMEGMDSANAKVLATKLINVVLALLAVLLLLISIVSSIINPFVNNRWKTLSLVIVAAAVILAMNHWEYVKTKTPVWFASWHAS